MSNGSSRRARVPIDNHGGPGRKDNSSIQGGTWSKVVSTAIFRCTRTSQMRHPKGERSRHDTLPQRLSGPGSAYVAGQHRPTAPHSIPYAQLASMGHSAKSAPWVSRVAPITGSAAVVAPLPSTGTSGRMDNPDFGVL